MAPSLRQRPEKEVLPPLDIAATRTKRTATASTTIKTPTSAKSPIKPGKAKAENTIVIPSRRSSRTIENKPIKEHLQKNEHEIEQQPESNGPIPRRGSQRKRSNAQKVKAHLQDHLLIITGIPLAKLLGQLNTKIEDEEAIVANEVNGYDGALSPDQPRKRRKVDWAARTAGSERRALRSDLSDTIPEGSSQEERRDGHSQESTSKGKFRSQGTSDMKLRTHHDSSTQENVHATTETETIIFNSSNTATIEDQDHSLQKTVTKSSSGNDIYYDAVLTTDASDYPDNIGAATNPPRDQDFPDISPRTPPNLTVTGPRTPDSPQTNPNDLPTAGTLIPYLPLLDPPPPRSSFTSEANYLLATTFAPIVPPTTFVKAITSHPLESRSTVTLLSLARTTQAALKAWQDEYLLLDKQTAPVTGPVPKKPATGGRVAVDPHKFEYEKARDLFGEGSSLASLRIPRAPLPHAHSTRGAAGAGANTSTAPIFLLPEAWELRRRNGLFGPPDASELNNNLSEDDAGATNGKRARKPARIFEIGHNSSGGRGNGGRRQGNGAGAGGSVPGTPARHGSLSEFRRNGADSVDDEAHRGIRSVPRKRGRLSALQSAFNNSGSATDTDEGGTPAPDGSDTEYNGPSIRSIGARDAPPRRRVTATNLAAPSTSTSNAPARTTSTAPSRSAITAAPTRPTTTAPNTSNKKPTTAATTGAAPRATGAAPKATGAAPKAAAVPSKAAGTGTGTGTASNAAAKETSKKPRAKSDKRSESMTLWWAERKKKQAEAKRLQGEADVGAKGKV